MVAPAQCLWGVFLAVYRHLCCGGQCGEMAAAVTLVFLSSFA